MASAAATATAAATIATTVDPRIRTRKQKGPVTRAFCLSGGGRLGQYDIT